MSPRRGGPPAPAPRRPQAQAAPPPPRPRWTISPPADPEVASALEDALNLPAPLCRLLAVRGHADPDAAKAFLRPMLDGLHDPGLLLDAPKAARRLARAVGDGEMVVVHGDYDVDGICAAVLLTSWIRALGGRADAIVPDRLLDGYDLSDRGVARAAERGAGVLVTVDCGIVAHGPVRRAARAGMDVIVTDHHRPADTLPEALAVVNPNRPDCPYPNKGLCGAGVAFKIGQLVAEQLGRPADESWEYLDLAALATVADMVPLEAENRTIARYGLRALESTSRPGLQALKRQAEIRPGTPVDAASVSFRLGPRINAAGRVGDARDAVRLLLTPDPAEAHDLARSLDLANRRRRQLEDRVVEEALAALHPRDGTAPGAGVVVAGEGWHSGVIGIVASRLVERVFRPVAVVALDGDMGRGSARSIPAFDLHAALAKCAGHLERFGGHRQAAGFDVRREQLPAFRAAFEEEARRALDGEEPTPELRADMVIELDEIDPDFYRYLRYLGPFGVGNPEPVFVARNLQIQSAKVVKNSHLKFHMNSGGAGEVGSGAGSGVGGGAGSAPDGGPGLDARRGTGSAPGSGSAPAPTPHLPAIGFGLAHRITPESLGAEPPTPTPPPTRPPTPTPPATPTTPPTPWHGARLPPVDVAFTLMENAFRGRTTIEARVRDIKPAG